ncbi:hypothetical protein PENSPDRAFT_586778 [Peniophora sp. CONT]|nr:hypothetical protein PENSPDRAFT_586778 [Peniophora sp. CONT]
MAHSLHWPSRYYYYPIGNTSAVHLTRDIAPDASANLLLLGCGDPRNVLYTVYCEPTGATRSLDFTCCDHEGAVLARNALLLTLVVDRKPQQAAWNIFYHMKLDKASHELLVEQCRLLADLAETPESWRACPYGRALKMCTAETLAELRRHWLLYAEMNALPAAQLGAITAAFDEHRTFARRHLVMPLGHARSAGPLMLKAFRAGFDLSQAYWMEGGLWADKSEASSATLLNPTFVYSRGRNASCVQYALCPTASFHLDAVYGNATTEEGPTVTDIVRAATTQFAAWCARFRSRVTTSERAPVVRLLWGDALAVAPCLHAYHVARVRELGTPVSQWTTRQLKLDAYEYDAGQAPTAFNIIDTSNLIDDVGLLNVIVTAAPLLASSQSVIYTESLLFSAKDVTKEFRDLLHGDLATSSFLIGLCPVDFLSGFSSRSNVHELRAQSALPLELRQQFHVLTAWKTPTSCDTHASNTAPPALDPRQLATFMYDIYRSMFEQEDSRVFRQINSRNLARAMAVANLVPYTRETFVHLMRQVRMRLRLDEIGWSAVINCFWRLRNVDPSMFRDRNNTDELWAHLNRCGLLSSQIARGPAQPAGPFAQWSRVPELVRVVMVVPRSRLSPVLNLGEEIGTPPMIGFLQGRASRLFHSIHVAFGTVTRMGTSAEPRIRFSEDVLGWEGSAPLVVSFIMPSVLSEEVAALNVHIAFMDTMTPSTALLMQALGPGLSIFHARITDQEHVYLLPVDALPVATAVDPAPPNTSIAWEPYALPASDIGTVGVVQVALDEQCESMISMTCKVNVSDARATQTFQGGTSPRIEQLAPCTMRLALGGRSQDIVFPFPVNGAKNKLRLARTSLYIEVIVPPSGGLEQGGMRLNRFQVTAPGSCPRSTVPWSIHRVNISTLPSIDTSNPQLKSWLDPHVQDMLSEKEWSIIERPTKATPAGTDTILARTDATVAWLKKLLRKIFVRSAGTQAGPANGVFKFVDDTHNCDMFMFVNGLRYDLAGHTIVCDAYILLLPVSLTRRITPAIMGLGESAETLDVTRDVVYAWNKLLPAFAERCRAWEHTANCEYATERRIPLTDDARGDLVPLCSCGLGKDVEGRMATDSLWRPFAPHVTRIAVSPLFAVSYLERVVRDPTLHRCALCRGIGKPKLRECTGCHAIRYCSMECQKADWKEHKPRCRRR